MTSVLAIRVARRYVARDFPNEKALEKYLHEHPGADKHKHHVTKHEDKGHGESEHGESEHGEHDDHHGGMFSRLKGALKSVAGKFKDAPKDVQKFIGDAEHRKSALKKGVDGIKSAVPKYVQAFAKTAKDEVKEFKTAGQGIGALLKGKKPTKAQKHAMKEVATHMAITIAASALTTATPALAAMAAGKALSTNLALKAATRVLGDLHALQEIGHIGHHAAHPLAHIMQHVLHNLHHLKLGAEEEGGGKEAKPEEIFGVLVMKHVAEQISKLEDDDYLAELLGDDDEDEDDGQQKQAARRVAARYLKIARPMMSPWDGEDHAWPVVPPAWDEERVQGDRFGDVFVMRYVDYGLAGSPMVTVDTTPWTHHQKPEFAYSIQVFDEKAKSGKIPLEGYERSIPKLLDEALELARREVEGFAKELDQLRVPHWEIEYDKRGDDLVVEYKAPGLSEYSDSSMSGSFYGPLAVFNGGKSDYHISYSKGADYEGHFGVRELNGEVRSLEDMKKVLRDAERMWAKAEKQESN